MKKYFFFIAAFLMVSVQLLAQTPVYLTKAYQPVESDRYNAYSSLEIQGGDVWNNCFTLGVINNYRGYATFHLGGKYESISFILGAEKSHGGNDPNIVQIHADGRRIFDYVLRDGDLGQHFTLNISGVDKLEFSLVKPEVEAAFCEVALWTKNQTPHDLRGKNDPEVKTRMLFRDIAPYRMNGSSFNSQGDGRHTWVAPDRKTKSIKIGNKTYEYGLLLGMSMQLSGSGKSSTDLNIRGQYESLRFVVGPLATDDGNDTSRGWVTVLGDGKILYEYEINEESIAQQVTLDVKGVNRLTFESEQASGSLDAAIVDAWVYPKGNTPDADTDVAVTVDAPDPRLKELPDVCKLITNIPPYSLRSKVEYQLYEGISDYVTFSMGGTKFNEGFILYMTASFLNSDLRSHAIFDLGNEFDYVSFTAGYVSKSWVMNNDVLRVYADDELILEAPLHATYPNQKFVLPINKCRKLKFESGGQSSMDAAAFGVADLVVYRGEPVENDLFVHPVPECPDEIDLIDLGAPYIHYVSQASSGVFVDGKSMKNYFTRYDGSRIYKGFVLQTSTHFSLDFGVLSGSDAVGAGAIGAAAVGTSFVATGAAIGGATIGATLAPIAPLLMLAAGGEAAENSCAAFNTYGQYNSVTFTVECLRKEGDTQLLGPDTMQPDISERKEKLLIGSDLNVVAELDLFEGMQPQTVTVPIEGCGQLMFWLSNTGGTSAAYVFHDIKVSKKKTELVVPEDMRPALTVVTEPVWTDLTVPEGWEHPGKTGVKVIDDFIWDFTDLYEAVQEALTKRAPDYNVYTYYLETEAGQICKAVKLFTKGEDVASGSDGWRIPYTLGQYKYDFDKLESMREDVADLLLQLPAANVGLVELGFGAISFGKVMKTANKMLLELRKVINDMYRCARENESYLITLLNSAVDIDGRVTTERTVFAPLLPGETPPPGETAKVRNFSE
ncbi:MAG: NPCBM/NEW2 domain-containing protein [Bacteroidales bacterium]|nr:NPCBM/NEW2 domain-containing protein [Bacteroidales bacterium]